MPKIDYHFHTAYSYDSLTELKEVFGRAIEAGLDMLCVTDHDTMEGALQLKELEASRLRIIVGCEFTTDDHSHVIGLNLRRMIKEKNIFMLMEAVKKQGGLVVLPHIFRRGSGVFRNEMRRSDEFIRQTLLYTDAVECFNGRDTWENNRRSHEFVMQNNLPAVAGSDAHSPEEIGSVYVAYPENDFVHGQSARHIFFPFQTPRPENPLKRKLMEYYHVHKEHLPGFVQHSYQQMKRIMKKDSIGNKNLAPRFQYEFPAVFQKIKDHEE